MTDDPKVSEPVQPELAEADPKTQLQTRLRTVLLGLPAHFEFNNHISGVNATDLFSLNTLLGASIEGQVVKALNQQRKLWDPNGEWDGYVFERQSQAFPDVRLVRKGEGAVTDIALGIELKGWFLLSKEGVPSFRFTTTPDACASHDLLVVVPWYLDNVLSGSPVTAEPYVVSARWAAQYRNYYWTESRVVGEGVDRTIRSPTNAAAYPRKEDQISDVPAYDGGNNFGRIARVSGLMTAWINATNVTEVLGIRIEDWALFLRMHSDKADPDLLTTKLRGQFLTQFGKAAQERAARATDVLHELVRVLDP